MNQHAETAKTETQRTEPGAEEQVMQDITPSEARIDPDSDVVPAELETDAERETRLKLKRRRLAGDSTDATDEPLVSTPASAPVSGAGVGVGASVGAGDGAGAGAAATVGAANNTNTPNPVFRIAPPFQVAVINETALVHPYSAASQKDFLGSVVYRLPTRSDPGSSDLASLNLFLLPQFDSSHLYATIDVRISAEHLSFMRNPAVQCRAVWGTDIYTDDSDVVAVIIHSGHYKPIDAPSFAHHVATTSDELEIAKSKATLNLQSLKKDLTATPVTSTPPQDSANKPEQTITLSLPTTSAKTILATADPNSSPPIPLHDVIVTLRVLPRLTKYTGTACTPAADANPVKTDPDGIQSSAAGNRSKSSTSSENPFSSRGWGSSHQGESIRVEKVVEVSRINNAGKKLAVADDTVVAGTKQNGAGPQTSEIISTLRPGRKSGAVEWCMVGIHERVFAPPLPVVMPASFSQRNKRKSSLAPGALAGARKEMFDVVRVLFSCVDGRACYKYAPQVLNEWPKFLQDGLVDLNAEKPLIDAPVPVVASSNACFGLTGPELKRMEGWSVWRVRLSVAGTTLCLEDDVGTRYEVTRHNASSSETYKISGISSSQTGKMGDTDDVVVVGLSDLEWRSGGMYIKGLQQLFETDRFYFKTVM
ncbi:histone deacetylation protein Rxt3-domain-containing protein [Chytriomyces cf. hyalinus JEL632]|nr:histone deacetylation protein Rxt3-domain-containing protein [Chytriomyces cf. hyalinus JEL632]